MSEQTKISECCITGHLHIGTPKGQEIELAGRKCYVTGDSANKKKTIFMIHDVWGYAIPNSRLLADQYAANGFYVYLPDLVDEDTIPEWMVKVAAPKNRELDRKSAAEKAKDTVLMHSHYGPWLVKHREGVVRPIIESLIQLMRADPEIGKLYSVGYCWGARYSVLYAKDGFFDAVVGAHPSFLQVPADLQEVTKPVSIAVGDKDTIMPIDDVKKCKAELDKMPIKSEVQIYDDAIHGFTIRGDLENEKERDQKEQAVKQVVAWFNQC